MTKTTEELDTLKNECETQNDVPKELSNDKLKQVAGGVILSYDDVSAAYYYLQKDTKLSNPQIYAKPQEIKCTTDTTYVIYRTFYYDKENKTLTFIKNNNRILYDNFFNKFDKKSKTEMYGVTHIVTTNS